MPAAKKKTGARKKNTGARKKTMVKSAAIDKVIDNAVTALRASCDNVAAAVEARAKDAKKFTAESKRIARKKATLTRRKRTLTARYKKIGGADTRKQLTATTKELAAVNKDGVRNRAVKSVNATELAALKASLKKTRAYLKEIDKADKTLNKPRRRRRRRTA